MQSESRLNQPAFPAVEPSRTCSFPPRRLGHFIIRHAVAVLSVAIALVLTRLWLPLLNGNISPLFFAAVMISAWYGGTGPGLLATVLATATTAYLIEPIEFGLDDTLRLGVFLMVSLLISSLTSLRKRAEEALKAAHAQLEQRVEQRTAELRAANALLAQSEERFRLLMEGVEDYAIFMIDPDGKIASWNTGAQRILGYRTDEIVGRHFSRFFAAEDARDGKPEIELRLAAEKGRIECEDWRVRKDQSRFWANVITTALRDDTGQLRGYAKVVRDITERQVLEKAILDIAEREQQRIGHDLHDGLGQELTGLAYSSQALHQRLRAKGVPEAEDAQRIAELIRNATSQARELARGLCPVELDAQGLVVALRQLASRVEGACGIPCRLACDGQPAVRDAETAGHLYRIAQEAVNNAVKHARAGCIDLSLGHIDHRLVLSIRDDGVGLPASPGPGKGMGLAIMAHRARMIGASLTVVPGPSGGTVVSCVIDPVHAAVLPEKSK